MNSVKNTGFRSLNKRSSKSAIQLATAWEPSSTRSWGLSHNAELMSRIAWLQTHDSEKAMAPHSSTLAWKIPWTEEPGRLQSMGLLRVGHDWVTSLSLSCIGKGNGNPLQCSCLENPRDGGAWWAAVYGVAQSRTWLKWLSSSSSSRHMTLICCFQYSIN